MVNTFSDWLFNVILWGAIVALVVLVYETFLARGFLMSQVDLIKAGISFGVVVLVSIFWPKF